MTHYNKNILNMAPAHIHSIPHTQPETTVPQNIVNVIHAYYIFYKMLVRASTFDFMAYC